MLSFSRLFHKAFAPRDMDHSQFKNQYNTRAFYRDTNRYGITECRGNFPPDPKMSALQKDFTYDVAREWQYFDDEWLKVFQGLSYGRVSRRH